MSPTISAVWPAGFDSKMPASTAAVSVRNSSPDTVLAILLVLTLWVGRLGPLMIATWQGTKTFDGASSSTFGSGVTSAANIALFLLAACVLLTRFPHVVELSASLVAAALAPSLYMFLREYWIGGLAGGAILAIAVVTTVLALRPSLEAVLGATGVLVTVTAGVSIVVGMIDPTMGLRSNRAGDVVTADKEIFAGAGLLQGVFSSENNMATFLAIGLAFTLMIRPWWVAAPAFAIVAGALLWSSSRGGLTAAVVAVVALLVPAVMRRVVFRIAAGAVALIVVLVPLLTTDEEAFSARGMIWQRILDTLTPAEFVVGGGTGWFTRAAADSSTFITTAAVQGHNQFVHLLATGGLVLVALVAVLFWTVARAVSTLDGRLGRVLTAWFVAMLAAGVLEVPFGASERGTFWPVTLVPLAAVLAAVSHRGRTEGAA